MLLACRNGAPWIGEQLNSILAQQDIDLRIAVSDDASTDETVELVRQLQERDSRITLRTSTVPSGSAGGNFRRLFRDIDSTDFDYVALSDQDDIWEPEKLAVALRSLQGSGASGYSCATRSIWDNGRERLVRQDRHLRSADFLFEGAGQGCTFVIRKDFFAEVQLFCRTHIAETEALHFHDWLIYVLARAWNLEWHFDPAAWIRYRQHENNEIGSRGSLKAITDRLAKIRNGWYANQIDAALRVAAKAAPNSNIIRNFSSIFTKEASWNRRLKLASFAIAHGRRRLSDRAVTSAAAILGWI